MLRAVVCKYFWFDMKNTSYNRCLNKWLRRIPDHKCMSNNIIGANKMNECMIILCRLLNCANDGILARLCKQVENIVFNNNKIAPKIFIFIVRPFHLNINHSNMHLYQWIFWRKDVLTQIGSSTTFNWINRWIAPILGFLPSLFVELIAFDWEAFSISINYRQFVLRRTCLPYGFIVGIHSMAHTHTYSFTIVFQRIDVGMKKGFVFTKHHINACSKFSWTKVLCHLKILSSAHEPPEKSSGMGN